MVSLASLRSLSVLGALGLTLFGAACSSEVEGDPGTQQAADMQQGQLCKEGDGRSCMSGGAPGFQVCAKTAGIWVWGDCEVTSGSTPLVLSFDGSARVDTAQSSAMFDLTGVSSVATDWPTSKTPWLALDRDASGAIEGGAELFGSATSLSSGKLATNGFLALAELDDNHDGRIDASDAAWTKLSLWSDADGDRKSTATELANVASKRLVSIDLAYTSERDCDARGNCVIERGTFRYLDEAGALKTGAVLDVHLKLQ